MDTESAHDHHLFEAFTTLSGNGRVKEDRIKKACRSLSINYFPVSIVKVDNPIDQRMQSPAAPLDSYSVICLHSTVLFSHVILANSIAIDLYCSLHYEMLKLVNAVCTALVF